ncbi:hypothetical protein SLS62_005184 [Diatrype stigma]|uniref:feruloyl esterase n=1 Tax=Diatrype stigma TaxID=117547 RepID=A0AAN9UTB0_9PEZI
MLGINTLATGVLAVAAVATAKPHSLMRAAAAAGSAGCGKQPPIQPGQWQSGETDQGRVYRYFLPATYDASVPAPLILSFHGAGCTIDDRVQEDRLSKARFNTDHVVVYLQGAAVDPDDPGSTEWYGAPDVKTDADLGFTADVLDAVEAALCVDTRRVYATGQSQGGGFVGRLACDWDLSRRIAAFAPVAGAFYNAAIDVEGDCDPVTMQNACDAGRADIPILELHGGNDHTINFHGDWRQGACLPAIRHWAKDWARRDGLDLDDRESDVAGTDGGQKWVYGNGLVTLVKAGDDVGHVWMSKDKGNADIEASEWVMDFFRKHSL